MKRSQFGSVESGLEVALDPLTLTHWFSRLLKSTHHPLSSFPVIKFWYHGMLCWKY